MRSAQPAPRSEEGWHRKRNRPSPAARQKLLRAQFQYQVFLEEVSPELITIRENSDIGPRVMVITHDTIFDHINTDPSHSRTAPVTIGRNCFIGAGAIVLPGVSIGDNTIIAAGTVVNKSIPPGSVVSGVPAKIVGTSYEWGRKHSVKP